MIQREDRGRETERRVRGGQRERGEKKKEKEKETNKDKKRKREREIEREGYRERKMEREKRKSWAWRKREREEKGDRKGVSSKREGLKISVSHYPASLIAFPGSCEPGRK